MDTAKIAKKRLVKDKKGVSLEQLRRIEKVRKHNVEWYGNGIRHYAERKKAERLLADVRKRIKELEGE